MSAPNSSQQSKSQREKYIQTYIDSYFGLGGRTSRDELLRNFNHPQKGVFLIKEKYISKVIQTDKNLGLLSLFVPHSELYVLSKESFLEIVRFEMPDVYASLRERDKIPPLITLIHEPTTSEMSNHSIEYFRYYYWGLIFHAEVHKWQLQRDQQEENFLDQKQINRFIQCIGKYAFEEIRSVLHSENYLFSPEDDREVVLEFMAYYLKYYHFMPKILSYLFPLLQDPKFVYNKIKEFGIEDHHLLELSRPEGSIPLQQLFQRRDIQLQDPSQDFAIFYPEYYLEKIYTSPSLKGFQLTREQFEKRYGRFLENLVQKIVYKGKIIGQLSFRDVLNYIVQKKVDIHAYQLLVLDTLLSESLSQLYRRATFWEKFLLEWRRVDFLQEKSLRQKRKDMTIQSLQKFQKARNQLEVSAPIFRKILFYLFFPLIFLYRVFSAPFKLVLDFVVSQLEIHSFIAQRIADDFRRRKFISALKRAQKKRELGNLVAALLWHKRAIYYFQEINRRFYTSVGQKLSSQLQAKLQGYLKEIQENFCRIHSIENRKTLEHLLQFLVSPDIVPANHRRLLQDIQKSYIDPQKEYFHLRIAQWIFTLGKIPLRQSLPILPILKKLKTLKSIEKRIFTLQIGHKELVRFRSFVRQAFHNDEAELREKFSDMIARALTAAEFRPSSQNTLQERLAFAKIKGEILDIIVEKGHMQYSDLRDVISRNDLKMKDLSGPKEFLFGDQLLRLDKEMAKSFKGLYRPAEIYMHLIHRISSLLFGISTGRTISKYLFLPFGGAFALLILIVEIWELIYKLQGVAKANIPKKELENFPPGAIWDQFTVHHFVPHITSKEYVIPLGFAILFFFFTKVGRTLGRAITKFVWRQIRLCFWIWPQKIWNFSWIQWFYKLKIWRFLAIFILKPAAYSLPFVLFAIYFTDILVILRTSEQTLILLGIALANLIINTPLGREIFDQFEDLIIYLFLSLNRTVFIGIFQVVMEVFRFALKWMEYVLYTVDDFFRFRKGDRLSIQIFKVIFGKIWYAMTYVFRFTINLIVEPQVNPIKHFPVVTISHKMILPLALIMMEESEQWLSFMGPFAWIGVSLVFLFTQFGIPGICGFMAWEFKENWKLYKKSAPKHPIPVLIGSHGERMPQLLIPGFHSGTLPRLYKKMRRACLYAYRTGKWGPLFRLEYQQEHLVEELTHFIQRCFLAQLQEHSEMAAELKKIRLEKILLSSQKIQILFSFQLNQDIHHFRIKFYLYGDLINGGVETSSSALFSSSLKSYLSYSFALLWKQSAVEFLPQILERQLPKELLADRAVLDFSRYEGQLQLKVFTPDSYQPFLVAFYPLDQSDVIVPRISSSQNPTFTLPSLPRERLIFAYLPLTWEEYNQAMERPDLSLPCKSEIELIGQLFERSKNSQESGDRV